MAISAVDAEKSTAKQVRVEASTVDHGRQPKPLGTAGNDPEALAFTTVGNSEIGSFGDGQDFDWNSGYAPFSDTDTPAEVDAVWRIQRRAALSHFVVFALVTFGVGAAIIALPWSADDAVFGGFSPAFLLAGLGLYVFFLALAVAASSLANSIEDRMMGAADLPGRSAK